MLWKLNALLLLLFLLSSTTSAQEAEVPVPSGGSKHSSRISSEGVVLGPTYKGQLQVAPRAPTPPGIETSFEGFGFDDNVTETGFFAIPPDSSGAAGFDRLVAVVNKMIEARNKSGGLIFRDSLVDFFAPLTPLTLTFDPKVIYDHYEDRFVVVALERVDGAGNPDAGNLSRILLAVSKTSSPGTATAADWHYTAIDSKTSIGGLDHWADYPGFEADEEAVYITANMFEFGGTSSEVRLWIVNKGVVGGFYAGGAAAITVHDPYAGGGFAVTTMPAQVYGPGGVGPSIGTFLVSYSGLTLDGGFEAVQVVRVDDPLGVPSFTQEFVSVGDIEDVGGIFGFPDIPDAPQLGTPTLIEVNDRSALDAVWRDDWLWFTTTINPNSGPDAGETTAHWFKLDTVAVPGAITLADQGDIGGEDISPNAFTFYPAVAVNGFGEAKFGFSASGVDFFAGAYATGRLAGDPQGAVRAADIVNSGQDFYVRNDGDQANRWGDYSGISVDPANDTDFWMFNQFADTRGSANADGDGRWGTGWGVSLGCSVSAPCTHLVTFVNPGSNSNQQSFLRFVNKAATPTDIEIDAFDDDGFAAPGGIVSTTLGPLASLQLTAQDLEQGNSAKGLFGSLGDGTGKWQLGVRANGRIEVLSLIRTPDGFLTSVNDVVPKAGTTTNEIFFANPASNPNQQSFLRFINQSDASGSVTLSGVDDSGNPAPGTSISFTLLARESKQLNSGDYENGNGSKGLSGALGDGSGKWHLTATSDVELEVMSLIRTPDGFLTNLSGVAPSDASQNHQIYYANPASETGQVTFLRIVNKTTGTARVTIDGIDDNGAAAPGGVVELQLGPLEAKQLLASDLENGNTGKGLTGALGDGAGKWQLIVTADVDIAVMNLIRTADGFLTNLSQVAPKSAANTTEVYLLNPASNTNQRSLLRVVNTTDTPGTVTITGADDNGNAAPGGQVSFQIGANDGLLLTAQDLENGNASMGLTGAFGDGAGKWHLTVESTVAIAVMSLLDTPNGFITNLSRPTGP